MKIHLKQGLAAAIAFLIPVALVLFVVAVIALFGGTVMSFFGFSYDSFWYLLLFFIIIMVISYPFEVFAGALPRVLLALGRISKPVAIVLYMILDILVTYIAFRFVDSVMDSVSATPLSILVLAIILALFGIKDIEKKPKIMERINEDSY